MPYAPLVNNRWWYNAVGQPAACRLQNGFKGNGVEVLPYSGVIWKVTPPLHQLPNGNWYTDPQKLILDGCASRSQAAYNKAYARFKREAVGDTSSLGTAAAEWRKSLDMVTSRTLDLYRMFRAVRKGDLSEMESVLGISTKRRRKVSKAEFARKAARNAAGTVLEYNFGWAPLLGDIFGSFEELSAPLPGGRAYGSAGQGCSWVQVQYDSPFGRDEYRYNGAIRYQCYADVYLANPNLFLLSQLGLVNPAVVAWELIPFSFLLDWIFDIQNYLESFTDWVGVSVVNPGFSTFCKGTVEHVSEDYYSPEWNQLYLHNVVESRRTPSIPKPVPNTEVQLNIGNSLTRAVNAASLLTTFATSLRPDSYLRV